MDNFFCLFGGLSAVANSISRGYKEDIRVINNKKDQIIILPTISNWSITLCVENDIIELVVIKKEEETFYIRNIKEFKDISFLRDLKAKGLLVRCARILDYILGRAIDAFE